MLADLRKGPTSRRGQIFGFNCA